MRKIIFIIIIIGICLGILGFWYWQRNPYSKEILKVEILGPERTTAFSEVEYTVKFKNNGNLRLEEPDLIFEFPEHALLEEGVMRREKIGPDELGDIYPGEEKTFKFKARLFGKENETQTAKVYINYRPKNLNTRYESTSALTTIIDSLPLTFDFDIPSKLEADRNFKFSLNYFSSLEYPLTDLGIKIEYPSNFEFQKSEPQAMGKTEWEIPLLNKAEGGRIEVNGELSGEIKEQKIFKAVLGVWQDGEFIILKEITRGVEITKPHILVLQEINNSREYVASPGELLHYEIFFRNIGEDPFVDLFLVARLDGKAFDLDSIKVSEGQVSKEDGSIVWDGRDISSLRFLDQGDEGKLEFWVNVKREWAVNSSQGRAVLRNTVLVSKVKEEFETKINTKLSISQKVYFQDEVFGNLGPVPPEVGKETTYTVIWQAKNYYNDVKNTKVKAILPSNVRLLTGEVFPKEEGENFTFDVMSREIVWSLGNGDPLEAGTGVLNTAPSIAFQVSLKPNSNQRGKTAQLIGQARISGEDQWTEGTVFAASSGVDSDLPHDSTVSYSNGIVK